MSELMPESKCELNSPALHRILPAGSAARPWPLHDANASRAVEHTVAASLPAHTLMRRAGSTVARLALALAPHAQRIWIAAGPGNNGGDGFDAAIHLAAAGKSVHVTFLGDAAKLPPDAADAYQRAISAGIPVCGDWPSTEFDEADLAIDALLGLGVTRPPEGRLADAVERLNHCAAPVLSIDLPSGLDANTGWLDAPDSPRRCVRARHTLSLLTLKPGLFTAHGRDQAGTIWFCDLNAAQGSEETARLIGGQLLAPRRHAQHKGSFGSVVVVGGAAGMSGAALLAGRAALHAGAGRVYVQLLDHGAPSVDLVAPELMLRQNVDWHAPSAAEYTAVVGCGGGQAVGDVLPLLISRARQLLLDADALNAVSGDPALQALVRQRAAKGLTTIMTPHPLEAARLLGTNAASVQADRLRHACELAQQLHAVVVLKGSGTIVQAPNGATFINPTGNASLGTAGTGDVLAGWIGALWTQGMSAEAAAQQAVFSHGLNADQWPHRHPDSKLTASALVASA